MSSAGSPPAPAPVDEVDVLVVGAGPVGLALAGDLGWRGVSCQVVEKSDGSIEQPRMDYVGVRTMEHCRRWGIVPWVEASPYPRDRRQDNVYVASLTGYEFGRDPSPSMADTRPPPESPQFRYRCPQDMFDPILLRHALSYPGVSIRYETSLQSLEERAGGVLVTFRDEVSSEPSQVLAKFVVGCDGASSRVRELLGVGMEGAGTLTYTTNVIFSCPDLDSLHDKSEAYRWIFIGREGTWATLVAINGRDRWRFSLIGDDRPRQLPPGEIQAAICRAVGVEREYELVSVLSWVRREGVASSYRRGRVFLAGDACHLMSPTGGFGMNTGIGDAVDLAWKLEATLSRWGGPGLLDCYEVERRPVAVRNATEASNNLARMLQPRREPPPAEVFEPGEAGVAARAAFGRHFSELMSREWHSIGIHLGYSYRHSPLCGGKLAPGEVRSAGDACIGEYRQSTEPGSRAPHVWLPDGSSTLDWFGRGFVLVQGAGSDALGAELVAAAARKGVPMSVRRAPSAEVAQAYEQRLVLVRPDGHVAWRCDRAVGSEEATAVIDRVRGARPIAAGEALVQSEEEAV